VHLLRDGFPHRNNLPLKESHPRIPEPHASQMFYYAQLDMLKSMSAGKSWSFCDVIPDMIVGWVPNNNIYCLPQALALYLSLYREINGAGAEITSPGSLNGWNNLSNDSSQDIIARFAIDASLHPEVTAEQSYNVADNSQPTTWSQKWPIICKYFELKGTSPENGQGPDPTQYVSDNRETWLEMEKKYGLQTGRVGNERSLGIFPMFIMAMLDFDRQLDLTKMQEAWRKCSQNGMAEEIDIEEAWYKAFDRLRKAKIIP
jgi:hypothetical protein